MIGMFDSGSGGLSVLRALRERMPKADVVYFGDIKNAPYGSKPAEELARMMQCGVEVLRERGADELISACNSISASVLAGFAGEERIIEMSRPAARFARRFAGKRMLMLATEATVRSRMYHDALGMIVTFDAEPVRELAGAIEDGASAAEIRDIVSRALAHASARGSYDVLLLGCTHYPLARGIIQREAEAFWPGIELFDPAEAVAEEASRRFSHAGQGNMRFIISEDSRVFRAHLFKLFPEYRGSIEAL